MNQFEQTKFSPSFTCKDNCIVHSTKEYNSRYYFETNKDALSIYNNIRNKKSLDTENQLVTFIFKGDKIVSSQIYEEAHITNRNNVSKSLNDNEIANMLNFAISLYPKAYRLSETRPWWCSSRFKDIKDYSATLYTIDQKNKFKFSMFLSAENWCKESAFSAEFYSRQSQPTRDKKSKFQQGHQKTNYIQKPSYNKAPINTPKYEVKIEPKDSSKEKLSLDDLLGDLK